MKKVSVTNKTRNKNNIIKAKLCNTFLYKLRGYMFYEKIYEDEGLLFVEDFESRINTAIHMLFMKFDLAIIWINSHNIIVDKRLAKRWRPFYISAKAAKYTLETHKNRLGDFQVNDELVFKEIN